MSSPIISVRGLSKKYRLGVFNARSLREEAEAFFGRFSRRKGDGRSEMGDRGQSSSPQLLSSSSAHPDEFWALRDVSFDVQPGEVLGIIGRNGAGKSTLLKILSRITEPTSGEARIRGRVASLLEVGTGFHPELSGRENIYLNGAILGMTRAEIRKKFDEIVAFAEVERFLDTPVKRYSSGMYVRLAFAVAAHLEPEILIVDEVLAVGDASFQKKCLGKMREVSASSGRTVLFVSHNMGAVRSLCSKACWLTHGSIREHGEVDTVVEAYLKSTYSEFTTLFDAESQPRLGDLGSAVRITEVRLNDGKQIESSAPFLAQIKLTASRMIEEISVGLGFCMLDGTRLLTMDSDLKGKRFSMEAGQSKILEMRINEFPLQPASYMVDIGIRSGNFHAIDYLPSAFSAEVVPGKETPPFLANSVIPGVRASAEWQDRAL